MGDVMGADLDAITLRAHDAAMEGSEYETWVARYAEDVPALVEEVERLRELLGGAYRSHYYCDDCWYSCPKAPDGCCDDSAGDECNCGADEWNARVRALIPVED